MSDERSDDELVADALRGGLLRPDADQEAMVRALEARYGPIQTTEDGTFTRVEVWNEPNDTIPAPSALDYDTMFRAALDAIHSEHEW